MLMGTCRTSLIKRQKYMRILANDGATASNLISIEAVEDGGLYAGLRVQLTSTT